jgi:putative phosphoesterase
MGVGSVKPIACVPRTTSGKSPKLLNATADSKSASRLRNGACPGRGSYRRITQREMKLRALKIFVMADTHDRLPPTIAVLARNSDEIWHLGDVCASTVLAAVERIGPPVTIVRGNCDNDPRWPLLVDLERNGLRFRLVHIPPPRPPTTVDVVLHGHTHVPRDEMRESVRFLNPGCVTRPNRGASASVATLEIKADGTLSWSVMRLG